MAQNEGYATFIQPATENFSLVSEWKSVLKHPEDHETPLAPFWGTLVIYDRALEGFTSYTEIGHIFDSPEQFVAHLNNGFKP